jgi:hypothetical protein
MIQAHVARVFGHARTLFTRTWELIRVNSSIHTYEMLKVAELVGKGIDFVWGDIYDSSHRPISEMTCFPEAATRKFLPSHYDYRVGGFWKLNTKA